MRGNGDGGLSWYIASGGTITEDWQHVSLVYVNGSSFRVYINGTEVGSNTQEVAYAHSATSGDFIGDANDNFGDYILVSYNQIKYPEK